jgi:hypothetical protein
MIPGATIPGSIFVANLWWYGFAVLRPAQALKLFGLYRGQEIGNPPARADRRGAGPHYSLQYSTPVLLNSQPDAYGDVLPFDELSGHYGPPVAPFAGPVFEEVVKLMRSLAWPESRILDCSCGPGTEMLALTGLVPQGEVVGTDLAADMVATAAGEARRRAISNVAFFQADVANLPPHPLSSSEQAFRPAPKRPSAHKTRSARRKRFYRGGGLGGRRVDQVPQSDRGTARV